MSDISDKILVFLKSDLDVIEGEVTQLDANYLWLRQDNGRELAIQLNNPQEAFRVGHRAKLVTSSLQSNPEFLRGVNLSTSYSISAIPNRSDTPNIFSAGGATLLRFGLIAGMLLLPIINLLFAGFLALGLLNVIGKVRHGFRANMIGWAVYGIASLPLIVAANTKGGPSTFVFVSGLVVPPIIGLIVGFGVAGRQIVLDQNDLSDRVDGMLYAA